ncbi:hypothetical protein TNCV_2823521 [Trichonephila clavipes]|nr:hypothetical protein TNCV_2823521 [Trichonephila clavipes]
MTPCGRSCHSLFCAVILLYLGTAAVAFPARPELAKDLVTWKAMVGRHILEDIVGRVAQYVDEALSC